MIPAGLLHRRSVALLVLVWLTYWSLTDPCNICDAFSQWGTPLCACVRACVRFCSVVAFVSAALASVFFTYGNLIDHPELCSEEMSQWHLTGEEEGGLGCHTVFRKWHLILLVCSNNLFLCAVLHIKVCLVCLTVRHLSLCFCVQLGNSTSSPPHFGSVDPAALQSPI